MLASMLAPAAFLALWSLLMLGWMGHARFRAIARLRIDLAATPAGARGQRLEGVLPDVVMWKSHNYTHLMEQPTVFYPLVFILALLGPSSLEVGLAWTYVWLRVLHSLWQAIVNTIPVRIALFTVSTLVLFGLALETCWRVLPLALQGG